MCKLLPLFRGLSGYVNHLNSQIQHDMFLLVSTHLDGIKFVWCNSICYTIRADMTWSQRTESIFFQSSESLFLLLLCCFIIPQAAYVMFLFFTLQTFRLSFTERKFLQNCHQETHTAKLVLNEQGHMFLYLLRKLAIVSAIWFQKGD